MADVTPSLDFAIGKLSPERRSNMFKITQLLRGRANIKTQSPESQNSAGTMGPPPGWGVKP